MNIINLWTKSNKNNILTSQHRATHTYVIGQPGTGKSRTLESWIMQDIVAGHGIGVIDPHGDLFNNLLIRLSFFPDVWKRIVIVDPTDRDWTININPLEAIPGLPLERTALFLTDVVMKIWKLDPTTAPRMLWLISNTFLALADLNLTLLELPEFLCNRGYRESMLPRLSNNRVRHYFKFEFPKAPNTALQWSSPILNKIGALIFDPDIRPMIAGGKTLNLREVMDNQRILLINLSKGILGEAASALLGAFILARLQSIALSRADTRNRSPFYLYLDEFQNYTTDNVKEILSESRKYGLSIIFAHQYLDQLPSNIRSAVLNTTGTLVCFRIGNQDARQLVREIFPSSTYLAENTKVLTIKQNGLWPQLQTENKLESSNWERLVQELSSLSIRTFWVKRRGITIPTKHRSYDMPDIKLTPSIQGNIQRLAQASYQRFGIQKSFIPEYSRYSPNQTNKSHSLDSFTDMIEDIPLWDR
ncbi:MAG: TraM recognition domain-containing protein [Anaerolineales bacterium]|jgi:hypothetical protein